MRPTNIISHTHPQYKLFCIPCFGILSSHKGHSSFSYILQYSSTLEIQEMRQLWLQNYQPLWKRSCKVGFAMRTTTLLHVLCTDHSSWHPRQLVARVNTMLHHFAIEHSRTIQEQIQKMVRISWRTVFNYPWQPQYKTYYQPPLLKARSYTLAILRHYRTPPQLQMVNHLTAFCSSSLALYLEIMNLLCLTGHTEPPQSVLQVPWTIILARVY